jgi:hypothetical protein
MAKIVVLIGNTGEPPAEMGVAAAEGAKGVRFAEVEIRTLGKASIAASPTHRPLASGDRLREYDAIIVASGERCVPAELEAALNEFERGLPRDGVPNTVFASVGSHSELLLGRLTLLGGIIVSTPRGTNSPLDAATATGARVAQIAEWVRHALSHQQEHSVHHHDHHHEQQSVTPRIRPSPAD